MPSVLQPIIETTRSRIASLDVESSLEAARAVPEPPSLRDALMSPGLGVIAEVKRRSPSAGSIAPGLDPEALARSYCDGGAVAVSVLTEPDHFGGSLEDLRAVSAAVERPTLRKDFVLDPAQIPEARAAGAAAVLLIVAILDDAMLSKLLEEARAWGVDALVEVHDRGELSRAVAAGSEIIGVNNRDLTTFDVDLETAIRLRPHVPDGVTTVAESGITSPDGAARMRRAGYDAVLVGEAAATATDPVGFVRSLSGP